MTEKHHNVESVMKETSPVFRTGTDADIDLLLLKDNMAKTPWERMQANDDALNFAESLRTAMNKHHAKLK